MSEPPFRVVFKSKYGKNMVRAPVSQKKAADTERAAPPDKNPSGSDIRNRGAR